MCINTRHSSSVALCSSSDAEILPHKVSEAKVLYPGQHYPSSWMFSVRSSVFNMLSWVFHLPVAGLELPTRLSLHPKMRMVGQNPTAQDCCRVVELPDIVRLCLCGWRTACMCTCIFYYKMDGPRVLPQYELVWCMYNKTLGACML